jgi:hypothetical protein
LWWVKPVIFAESQPKVHRGLITYSRQFGILSTKTAAGLRFLAVFYHARKSFD